ncbi:hypothetical protein SUGI_0891320 [Cryptomeria japonica]|nr:hypothetical protein SUGI_0891320 [Cryptomeria japonica]
MCRASPHGIRKEFILLTRFLLLSTMAKSEERVSNSLNILKTILKDLNSSPQLIAISKWLRKSYKVY